MYGCVPVALVVSSCNVVVCVSCECYYVKPLKYSNLIDAISVRHFNVGRYVVV